MKIRLHRGCTGCVLHKHVARAKREFDEDFFFCDSWNKMRSYRIKMKAPAALEDAYDVAENSPSNKLFQKRLLTSWRVKVPT